MIYSKDDFMTVVNKIAYQIDKILIVDTERDTFSIVKINDKELDKLSKKISYTEWVTEFAHSINFDGCDVSDFIKFTSIKHLKKVLESEKSVGISYKKYIKNNYHNVFFEIMPINSTKCFILIKDFDVANKSFSTSYDMGFKSGKMKVVSELIEFIDNLSVSDTMDEWESGYNSALEVIRNKLINALDN